MRMTRIAVLLAAALVLDACAAGEDSATLGTGGGGLAGGSGVSVSIGTGGGGGGGGQTAAGTFTRSTIPDGSAGAATPFTTEPLGGRQQILVRAGDINGSGFIRSIRFRLDESSFGAVTCSTLAVKFGHTNREELTTTFDGNYVGRGSATTVLTDGTVDFPAGAPAGTLVELRLDPDRAFIYNGADNLVVEISSSQGCTHTPPAFRRSPATYVAQAQATPGTAPTATMTEPALYHLEFKFVGGDDVLAKTGAAIESAQPFTDASGADRRVQLLYLADEIRGAGPITGIAFPAASTTTAATYTVTVKLGHAAAGTLGSTFALNYADTPVTVANGASLRVPAGVPAGSFVWLSLPDGAFTYNGTDNLVVEVEVNAPSGTTAWRARANMDQSRTRTIAGRPGAPSGTPDVLAYDLRLRFAGGTMDVLTPNGMIGGASDDHPFGTEGGRRQYLYLASELGSRGTLAGIACRLRDDLVAAPYPNYEVQLGHTSATSLTEIFPGNLPNPTTVFLGPFEVQGDLREGDWIEIPFSTSFAYNGRDNLIVEIAGPPGTAQNLCVLDTLSPARYAARRLAGLSPLTGAPSDSLLDLRFVFK